MELEISIVEDPQTQKLHLLVYYASAPDPTEEDATRNVSWCGLWPYGGWQEPKGYTWPAGRVCFECFSAFRIPVISKNKYKEQTHAT